MNRQRKGNEKLPNENLKAKTSKIIKFSVSKAHKAQILLSKKIVKQNKIPEKRIKLVAGVDASYHDDFAVGAVAVLDYASMKLLEAQTAICTVKFPYVSTLLSFREIPSVMASIRKLKLHPDVFLVDAHGMSHPYRFGFASHLGIALAKPTIGVAKSRLIGETRRIGKNVFLIDKGEIIGAAITPAEGVKPIYVSIGHQVSLQTAIRIVRHCIRNTRIPEPILLAHKLASEKISLQGLEKIY